MNQLDDFLPIVRNMMEKNVLASGGERVVVITDLEKEGIGRLVFDSLCALGFQSEISIMQTMSRSGEEPPATISAMMKEADVCLCICEHSLTHTRARKAASQAGTKVITMPGITMDMFTDGAMKADYDQVKNLTRLFTEKLDSANRIKIVTGKNQEYVLHLNIKNRKAISSTGVFEAPGASGNLPSGESYLAPVMEGAEGEIKIDGSIAGIGKMSTPILLNVKEGRLVSASEEAGSKLLDLLGDGDGRVVAEFGIGTNNTARVSGNILEDEKAFGTIHVAFGSNVTFGGTIDAGVHIDCVTLKPSVWIEDEQVIDEGKFSVSL